MVAAAVMVEAMEAAGITGIRSSMAGVQMDFIAGILIVGLSSWWLTRLVRAFGFMQPILDKYPKPFLCNVCMSFWTSLLVCAVWSFSLDTASITHPFVFDHESFAYLLPGAGLSLLVLELYPNIVASHGLSLDDMKENGHE